LDNLRDAADIIYIEDMIDAGEEIAKNTLPLGTLQSFLIGTKWDENDLERLGLII